MADISVEPLGLVPAPPPTSSLSVHGSFREVIARAGVDPTTRITKLDNGLVSFLVNAGLAVADVTRFIG